MNAAEPASLVARGLVDHDGRLVEGDAPLADLNARAGGRIGAQLAIPQLAALARLARRLNTPISRGVLAADGDQDIDLWVRAEPVAQGVVLALSGWRLRPAWAPPPDEARRDRDFIRNHADWRWETDTALCLTFVSVAASVDDGTDLEGVLGRPLTQLFTLDPDGDGDLPILRALSLRSRFDDQPALIRASGCPVRLAAVPRVDAGGAFAGFVGAAHLIDAELIGQIPPAAAGDAFTSRLDRALRGPLGKIIANADTLYAQADGPLGPDYAGYATDIATAGRHLLGLVDDLVDLQAIERADFDVTVEPIDLADLARRAAGLLSVRAADARVKIDRPALGEALPATGEVRRILQILVNLIGNAVRYSPEGSTVWVRAEREGDTAAVIVADQGKGIALEDQARIFDKFERVDTREPGGSGLGLYIARRLARAMGGDITVDSAPGQGARFLLTLPAREPG